MYIIGIDPGGTTGIVECELPQDDPLKVVDAYELSDMFEVGKQLREWWNYTNAPSPRFAPGRLIICEAWVDHATLHATNANAACQPIGMIRWLAENELDVPIQMQLPQARDTVTEQVMKDTGYWLRGGAGHKRQALRHVLAYCVNKQHMPTINKLYPR